MLSWYEGECLGCRVEDSVASEIESGGVVAASQVGDGECEFQGPGLAGSVAGEVGFREFFGGGSRLGEIVIVLCVPVVGDIDDELHHGIRACVFLEIHFDAVVVPGDCVFGARDGDIAGEHDADIDVTVIPHHLDAGGRRLDAWVAKQGEVGEFEGVLPVRLVQFPVDADGL